MRARTFFEELTDTPEYYHKYGRSADFQIFVPEKSCIVGYFKNKNMNSFDRKKYLFLETPEELRELKRLNKKISKGKFIKKMELSDALLEKIILSSHELNSAIKNFNKSFDSFICV